MIALGGAEIADWMVDTFIYTALLIGIVLVVRRRVAEFFGPQIAYALWALPLLRFIMPPLVLPSWMKPAETAVEVAPHPAASAGEPAFVFISGVADGAAGAAPMAADTALPAAAPVAQSWFDLTVTDLLLPLWLGGAVLFLAWRAREYMAMRRDLLGPARPVGEVGDIRLVETPAVSAPVAFGVRDKVVALPPEFMDRIDIRARDLAIAHELEHHRGRDLLANFAAQPLLALHWFNPLAWWGWRAMRRDQEAACDARVVAGRARSERAAYAEVIAGFAAGQHLALAAPMATGMTNPVLGEKSIIHRLRSLTMQDISSRRRRIGIAAITTSALTLPLTASISYAQAEEEPAPDERALSGEDAMPDAQPLSDEAPWVDAQPEPAPDADADPTVEIIRGEDGEVIVIRTETGDDGERRVTRRVIRTEGDPGDAIDEEELERIMAEVEREVEMANAEVERSLELAMAEVERAHEAAGRVVFVGDGGQARQDISLRCRDGEAVATRELADGRTAMMVCNANIEAMAHNSAAMGLREARNAIGRDASIPAETRREIMREMEEAIEELEEARREMRREMRSVSVIAAPPRPPRAPKPPEAAPAPRVTFGFTATLQPVPATVRSVPMVHPLTGRVATPADEDCEEAGAQVRNPARVIA